jgi:hypothetical protein
MRIAPVVLLVLLSSAVTSAAGAQAPDDENASNRSSTPPERVLRWFTDDDRAIRPLVDVVVPGSGLAGGLRVESPSIGGTRIGAGVEGLVSVRNYQHLVVRIGYLGVRRTLPDLGQADSAITSTMDAGRGGIGNAIYVEHRYRRLPRLNYFGVDGDTVARTDFGADRTTTDLVGQWAPGADVGFSARVGVMTTETFAGTDDGRTDTREIFGDVIDAPRLQRTRYVTSGIGVLAERLDDGGLGWMVDATAIHFASTRTNAASFTRMAFDARLYRRAGLDRHVVAARLLVSADAVPSGRHVPYYLQQTLGGSSTARALSSYRLRGNRLVSLNLESRWRVGRVLEVVPFVDIGRAWQTQVATGLDRWVVTPGFSLRARMGKVVVARAGVAKGPDGFRVVYAFDAPF